MNIIFILLILKNIFLSHATECGIYLPNQFLSPTGLSTPFILKTIASNIECSITNPKTTVFVEALILDPETKLITVYHPLIVNDVLQVEINPEIPTFSKNSIVSLWFSSNSLSFSFINIYPTCVDGTMDSKFKYFSYCNAVLFFSTVSKLNINIIELKQNCPSIRSFSFINEYQSYKTLSSYLITDTLKVAQNLQKNRNILNTITVIENTNDGNKLLVDYVHQALSCNTFKVLSNTENVLKSSLALNELQASLRKDNAYIMELNPMISSNDNKLKLYRLGVNQPIDYPIVFSNYCISLAEESKMFMFNNYDILSVYKTPDPYIASNLLTYMGIRFINAWEKLNCSFHSKRTCPIKINYDNNGIGISTIININNTVIKTNRTEEEEKKENEIEIILGVILIILTIFFCLSIYWLVNKHNKDLIDVKENIIKSFSKIVVDSHKITPIITEQNISICEDEVLIQIDYDTFFLDTMKLQKEIKQEKENNKKKLYERIEAKKKLKESS
jgi:hypothetical protein